MKNVHYLEFSQLFLLESDRHRIIVNSKTCIIDDYIVYQFRIRYCVYECPHNSGILNKSRSQYCFNDLYSVI